MLHNLNSNPASMPERQHPTAQSRATINGTATFTLEELSQYDGIDGRPAYVAVNGVVYDLTNNPVWRNGMHHGNRAGTDLTEVFTTCHSGTGPLMTLPVVGHLVESRSTNL